VAVERRSVSEDSVDACRRGHAVHLVRKRFELGATAPGKS
jgi:hypothetical protein